MRNIALLLASALSVAACGQSPGEAAEAEFDVAARAGAQARERCAVARRVAAAWLAERNQAKYEFWSVRRDVECNGADLDDLDTRARLR